MDTNCKPNRPGMSFHASVIGFQGDTSHRRDANRAVMMENHITSSDKIFNETQALHKSIEEALGKFPREAQLEADRKSYELKDNIRDAFDRIKNFSV